MSALELADLLDRSAQRLERPNSWVRRSLLSANAAAPEGIQACAIGTIGVVAYGTEFISGTAVPCIKSNDLGDVQLSRIRSLIEQHEVFRQKFWGRHYCANSAPSLTGWNDNLAKDQAEVVELFKLLACVLRLEEEQAAVIAD